MSQQAAPTTAANGSPLPPLPADHLEHPEQWATGGEPATANQKGFIHVLEDKHPELVPEGGVPVEGLSKSEGSEVIDMLKKGEKVGDDVGAEKEGKEGSEQEAAGESSTAASKSESTAKATKRKSVGAGSAAAADDASAPTRTDAKKEGTNGMHVDEPVPSSTDDAAPADGADGAAAKNGDTDAKAAAAIDDEARPAKKSKTDAADVPAEVVNADKQETINAPTDAPAEPEPKPDTDTQVDEDNQTDPTPATSKLVTPEEPESATLPSTLHPTSSGKQMPSGNGNGDAHGNDIKVVDAQNDAGAGAGAGADTQPGEEGHLDHPENWATGDQPATDKQKGFLKVLEQQKGVSVGNVDALDKTTASEKIDELKSA